MCATGAGAQQPTVDQEAAKIYYNCLRVQADLLDDGLSDAGSIGLGVAGACAAQRGYLAARSSAGSMELQRRMQASLDAKAREDATSFVLAVRKGKAKAPASPKAKSRPKGEAI